jgi:hypothetical protein
LWFDLIVDVDVATEPRFVEAGFRIFEITAGRDIRSSNVFPAFRLSTLHTNLRDF